MGTYFFMHWIILILNTSTPIRHYIITTLIVRWSESCSQSCTEPLRHGHHTPEVGLWYLWCKL